MLCGSKFDMELNLAIWILQRFHLEAGSGQTRGEEKSPPLPILNNTMESSAEEACKHSPLRLLLHWSIFIFK